MSKIICFGNMKGGVGKTTCTILAANALSNPPFKKRVTIIDTDAQKSIVKLRLMDSEDYSGVMPYQVLNMNVPTFMAEIKQLDKQNDFIFIDIAGKLDTHLPVDQQEISKVINYVDHLLIPFTAGNFSIEASLDFIKFALNFQQIRAAEKRPFNITGFINMNRQRTRSRMNLGNDVDYIRKVLEVPFMKASLNDYALFRDADTLTSEYSKTTKDTAKENYSKWINELYKLIK